MKNIRGTFKFFPVGQGLFYGGHISCDDYHLFTFVYDCGAEDRWQPYLNNAINSFPLFAKRNPNDYEIHKLDLIVVSHLHRDHFLGIYDLIQHVGMPRKIILPLIEGDVLTRELVIFSLFLGNEYVDDNDIAAALFFLKLYSNSKSLSDVDTTFIFDERDRVENAESFFLSERSASIPLMFIGNEIWRFEFVNGSIGQKNTSVIANIRKDIKSLLLSAGYSSIEEYLSADINGFNKLKVIFKNNGFSTCASFNNTSTLLLHYPITKCPNSLFSQDLGTFYVYPHPKNIATLLTGDSKINKNQSEILIRLLDKIEPTFLITQLPHHGSDDNFKSLSKYLWTYIINGLCVVSYGIGNTYKHPGPTVLHSFSLHQLIKVNEYHDYLYVVDS